MRSILSSPCRWQKHPEFSCFQTLRSLLTSAPPTQPPTLCFFYQICITPSLLLPPLFIRSAKCCLIISLMFCHNFEPFSTILLHKIRNKTNKINKTRNRESGLPLWVSSKECKTAAPGIFIVIIVSLQCFLSLDWSGSIIQTQSGLMARPLKGGFKTSLMTNLEDYKTLDSATQWICWNNLNRKWEYPCAPRENCFEEQLAADS